jgi:hypothetical protein
MLDIALCRTPLLLAGACGAALLVIVGCSKSSAPQATGSIPASPTPPTNPAPPSADPYDQLAEEILRAMDKLAADVAAIKTTEAAAAAVPQMEREVDELRYSVERLKGLSALPSDELERKKAQYAQRVKSTAEAFDRQARRVRGHSQLNQPLRELQTRMTRLKRMLNGTALAVPRDPTVSAGPPPGFFGPTPGFPGPPSGVGAPPVGFPGGPQQLEGPDIAVIVVTEVPDGMFGRLSDVVRELNDYRSHSAQATGEKATFRLAQVSDFRALPDRITFGKVTSLDEATRTITVELDPAKIP